MDRRNFLKDIAGGLALAAFGNLVFLSGCNQDEADNLEKYRQIKGFCYSPFREGQSPTTAYPDAEEIRSDLKILKNAAPKVRTYGTSRTLFDIPRICSELGIDCYPCAYVNENDPQESEGEISRLIELGHKGYPTTKGLIVGNEYLLRAETRGDFLEAKAEIISWIKRVRAETGMPVGTTDGWHLWNYDSSKDLAEACDFIMIHIHPFWESQYSNPNISIDNALNHTIEKYHKIKSSYSGYGKPIIIGETGWPSSGSINYAAVPTPENQARYMDGFFEWAESSEVDYFAFEAFDEPWKGYTENSFGLFDKNRNPKPAILA